MEKINLLSFDPIKNSISEFLFDEEGNVTRNKVLAVGSMIILMGILFIRDIFAAHSSHSSHKSHSSHSSGSGGHSSHVSHTSHTSHTSSIHSSHSSATHSSAVPSHNNVLPSHSNVVPTAPKLPAPNSVPIPNIPQVNHPETNLPGSALLIPVLPETPKK